MKRIVSVFTLVMMALALMLTACSGSSEKEKQVTKSAAEIYTAVSEAGKLEAMTAVPSRDFSDVYGIDAAMIEDSAWYMSENPSLNADEVAIFKLSSEEYAKTLATLLKDRIARQLQVAEIYSPEEAAKIKAAEVVTVGNWVYYCIGTENAAMMNVLRAEIG